MPTPQLATTYFLKQKPSLEAYYGADMSWKSVGMQIGMSAVSSYVGSAASGIGDKVGGKISGKLMDRVADRGLSEFSTVALNQGAKFLGNTTGNMIETSINQAASYGAQISFNAIDYMSKNDGNWGGMSMNEFNNSYNNSFNKNALKSAYVGDVFEGMVQGVGQSSSSKFVNNLGSLAGSSMANLGSGMASFYYENRGDMSDSDMWSEYRRQDFSDMIGLSLQDIANLGKGLVGDVKIGKVRRKYNVSRSVARSIYENTEQARQSANSRGGFITRLSDAHNTKRAERRANFGAFLGAAWNGMKGAANTLWERGENIIANRKQDREIVEISEYSAEPVDGANDLDLNEKGQYVIQKGDTLRKLSERTGISIEELAKRAGTDDPDFILEGGIIEMGKSIEYELTQKQMRYEAELAQGDQAAFEKINEEDTFIEHLSKNLGYSDIVDMNQEDFDRHIDELKKKGTSEKKIADIEKEYEEQERFLTANNINRDNVETYNGLFGSSFTVFKTNDNEVHYVFRGTEGGELRNSKGKWDIWTDTNMLGVGFAQYYNPLSMVQRMQAKRRFVDDDSRVVASGHSLGAALVQRFALYNQGMNIDRGVTFQGAGVGILEGLAMKLSRNMTHFTHHIATGTHNKSLMGTTRGDVVPRVGYFHAEGDFFMHHMKDAEGWMMGQHTAFLLMDPTREAFNQRNQAIGVDEQHLNVFGERANPFSGNSFISHSTENPYKLNRIFWETTRRFAGYYGHKYPIIPAFIGIDYLQENNSGYSNPRNDWQRSRNRYRY